MSMTSRITEIERQRSRPFRLSGLDVFDAFTAFMGAISAISVSMFCRVRRSTGVLRRRTARTATTQGSGDPDVVDRGERLDEGDQHRDE